MHRIGGRPLSLSTLLPSPPSPLGLALLVFTWHTIIPRGVFCLPIPMTFCVLLGLALLVFIWHTITPRVVCCLPIAMTFCMLLGLLLPLPLFWLRGHRTLVPPASGILCWPRL